MTGMVSETLEGWNPHVDADAPRDSANMPDVWDPHAAAHNQPDAVEPQKKKKKRARRQSTNSTTRYLTPATGAPASAAGAALGRERGVVGAARRRRRRTDRSVLQARRGVSSRGGDGETRGVAPSDRVPRVRERAGAWARPLARRSFCKQWGLLPLSKRKTRMGRFRALLEASRASDETKDERLARRVNRKVRNDVKQALEWDNELEELDESEREARFIELARFRVSVPHRTAGARLSRALTRACAL